MRTDDVYVALGSNLGDSAGILLKAWQQLGTHEQIETMTLSPPYLSAPVDMISQHWFVNAVGQLATSLTSGELLDVLFAVETKYGRERSNSGTGYQDRTLDLDLLYFGSEILDKPRLTLPHPRRADRLFVMAPLAHLNPDFVDPELSRTVGDLHRELLEKIEGNTLSDQEISVSTWSKLSDESR